MLFLCTRNSREARNTESCLLQPLGENGGLFVPTSIPRIDYDKIYSFANMPFSEVVSEIIFLFAADLFTKDELKYLCAKAYTAFKGETLSMYDIDERIKLLNLTYGPTGCIKDYGTFVVAALIEHLLKKKNHKMNIIDFSHSNSGCSILAATKDKELLRSFIVFNKKTIDNVAKSIAIDNQGSNNNFMLIDVPQQRISSLQTELYNNTSFQGSANLVFINEVNLFNILVYTAMCFYSYLKIYSKPFCVSIPTGNMGIANGVLIAKQMGLPIQSIILAVEKNNFLHTFCHSGRAVYEENKDQLSANINFNLPSNFERLLYYIYNTNQGSIKRLYDELLVNGRYNINVNVKSKISELFYVAMNNNDFITRNCVYNFIRKHKMHIENYTALAITASEEFSNNIINIKTPIVVFQTQSYIRNIKYVSDAVGYDVDIKKEDYALNNDNLSKFDAATIMKDDFSEIYNFIYNKLYP